MIQRLLRSCEMTVPLLALLLLIIWATYAVGLLNGFGSDLPDGQAIYIVAKALGLIAIGVAGLQLLIGYTASRSSQYLHIAFGSLLVLCVLLHWLLFSWAVFLRTQVFPWHLLQPWSDGNYYSLGVMFGAIALWLLFLIVLAGVSQVRRFVWAKYFHRLGVTVFIFALVHALMIGTEAQSLWGQFYLAAMGIVVVIALLRVWFIRLTLRKSEK